MSRIERPSLDQLRAGFAWRAALAGVQRHGADYRVVAKGASALVMNSGLMPTLAFLAGKGDAHKLLCDDLCSWLAERLGASIGIEPTHRFASVMNALHACRSEDYLRGTQETLETLKWIRQYVDAVPHADDLT